MKNKLPKQWKDWLRAANFTSYKARGNIFLFDSKGRGRRWRINCHGQMQCSEVYAEFDRWANSTWITTDGIPKSKEEFLDRVSMMEKRALRKERLRDFIANKQNPEQR